MPIEGNSKDPKGALKRIFRCLPHQMMRALKQQPKEKPGKAKKKQSGKLLTKRDGQN